MLEIMQPLEGIGWDFPLSHKSSGFICDISDIGLWSNQGCLKAQWPSKFYLSFYFTSPLTWTCRSCSNMTYHHNHAKTALMNKEHSRRWQPVLVFALIIQCVVLYTLFVHKFSTTFLFLIRLSWYQYIPFFWRVHICLPYILARETPIVTNPCLSSLLCVAFKWLSGTAELADSYIYRHTNQSTDHETITYAAQKKHRRGK